MKTPVALLAGLGVMFCSAATALAGQVTFQVNMSAQTALGNFNPALDTVSVAGDAINGWSTTASLLAPSPTDPNIWLGTFEVTGAAGITVQYKFVMLTSSGTTWEGNVGPGGPTGNRTLTLSDADQTLPVVFFNNVTSGAKVSADVTFQVNMAVQIALGSFDGSLGTVSVAGEFNGWSTSEFVLTQSASDPDIWVGTRTLTGAADSSINYKFVMNGSTWEGNVGLNGAQNRALTLTSTAQVLPVVFFNNVTAVPSNIPITFQVNLAVWIAQGNFDPAMGTVSVAGDLLNNWNTSASVLTRSATDPNLWAGTFEVNSSAGAVMLFKYVLNDGATWESIDNRSYTIASTDPQVLPPVFFNNVNNLGALSLGVVSAGQVTVSWTAGPLIRLQTTTDLGSRVWQDVPNTLGQSSATFQVGSGQAFFQLVGP
jgi:hypothetical protein